MRPFSVGWYETLARAIFGYQEHTPLALEDAIRATIDLSRLRPEWHFPAGILPFQTLQVDVAAAAGVFSSASLWVPPDVGVLAVVTDIRHNSGITALVRPILREGDAALGEVSSENQSPVRDTRFMPDGFGLTVTRHGFQVIGRRHATALGPLGLRLPSENTSLVNVDPRTWWVIGPNGMLVVEPEGGSNQALADVVFIGYILLLHKGKRA